MTVAVDSGRASYATNGTTGPFTIPFYFLDATHLQVVHRSSAGVETTLALNTDYTVTGAGAPAGGSLTTTVAYAAGGTLTVVRDVPLTQETDYGDGDSFPAESHERALDKLTMIGQQHAETLARALVLSVGTAGSATLPDAATRALKLLSFDAAGVPIVVAPASGSAADLAATLAASSGSSAVGFIQSGTGATATTVQTALRERLTPENFGAVGDGVANDSTAFANALTAAVSSGRTLHLRAGATYLLSSWTVFSNSGLLRIEGHEATVRGPVVTVDFLSPAANFDIRDCVFDRWNSVVERLLAQSGSFTDVQFIGNRCAGCEGQVINIERPIEQYRIERNDFENCTGGYAVRIGENTFANQDTWVRGWIVGNRFRTLSASGAVSAAAILVYGREVTIADNKIDGVTQSGTGEAWGIYTKVRYGHVHGNYINNVVPASNGDNVGINIKGNTRAITSSPQGFAAIVYGNHVRNIGSAGVRGSGIRAQTDDVLVIANECEDCGTNGIVSDETSSHRNVRILHNLVRYAANVAGTVGIRLEGAGFGVTAEHNTIRNAQTGVRLVTGPSASTMADGQVVRNLIEGATSGIVIDAFSGCTLDRPVIEHNIVTGGTNGLVNNGSPGTISNARIRFNDLARAATPALGPFGTTPAVEGNIGYLAASSTWDPPSIANGASAATTLTVAGAAVGDAVICSFSLPLNNLVMVGQVSAADQAEVRLINNSGGAVDLGSGTVRVRVIKGIA